MVENMSNIESGSKTPMKVYELAKELGIDSIALVDKLAALNIRVKNHMSDLDGNAVLIAKESFLKSTQKTPQKPAARSGVKRKAAASTSAEPAKVAATPKKKKTTTSATSSATKTLGERQLETNSALKSSANVTTDTKPQTTTGGAESGTSVTSARTVIRRRTKEGDSGLASTGLTSAQREARALETSVPLSEELVNASEVETAQEIARENLIAVQLAQEELAIEEEQAKEVKVALSPVTQSGSDTSLEQPMTDTGHLSIESAAAKAEATKASLAPQTTVSPRRSFLNIVSATPVTKPRIVTQAPIKPVVKGGPTAPGMRGTTTQDKDGFRTIRMTKENLDQMAEEESAKKKLALKGTLDIKPEDVRFADYRKKEMVFLPKRKKIALGRPTRKTEITTAAAHKRVVEMGDRILVSDLADQMQLKSIEVVRKLMGMGVMTNMNQSIDFETAALVGAEFKYEVKNIAFKESHVLQEPSTDESKLSQRPPVVTIMGHVDHGKTSLLDAIRSANVAGGEFGGITQHIGAYTVVHNGSPITFIDTPGHEAFTAMRARGANVTDIVVLVVAADDAVMPQTREALSHAKAAGVQILVAVNKMDKPGASPEKVKQQLAEMDLLAEDWGGQTIFAPVSALKKTGIPELLESILLTAEVLDLKSDATARVQGIVLESRMEKGRGPVASVLIKRGTLKVGDLMVSGLASGKVKALHDDQGKVVKEVSPGYAAEILGFETLPVAGEKFDVVSSERDASDLIANRKAAIQATKPTGASMSLEALFKKVQAGETKELGVVVKADVSGTVEAVRESLVKLSTDKVKIKILFSAPGGITESDVLLASASKAIIVGFNVRPETSARKLAESKHIEIKCYNIIYELIDDVRMAMAGVLDKKKVEKFLGRAEIRQTFSVPKIGTVAGCFVVDGKMLRGASVRLLRDSRILFEGKLSTLKRFKDDAKEVLEGYECGLGLEGYQDIKVGDLVEAYTIELVAPEL